MSWQEYQMLWPVQNRLVLVHLYADQSASFEVSDLDGELCESDSKQFHEEFDTKTSAHLKCNHVMFTMSHHDQIIITILNEIRSQTNSLPRKGNIFRILDPPE